MERKLVKLLLDRDFWQENKHKISPQMFPSPLDAVYRAIKEGHERYQRTLSLDEVKALHMSLNPTMTRAARNALSELFLDIQNEELVGQDIASDVLHYMWRAEVGRQVADLALNLIDGKITSLAPIQSVLDGVSEDFTPTNDVEPVTDDVEALVTLLDRRSQWKFNLETLNAKLPGMSGGEFAILFARPEAGKTAAWVSFCAGPGGFCDQGASVHVVCNEEPAIRTQMRAISAYTGMTKEEIIKDPKKASGLYAPLKGKLKLIDDVTMSIDKLDSYCRKHKPDVLVIDQLDKIKVQGNYEQGHEMLRSIYTQSREIAKKHSNSLIGVCQASAEGQDKAFVHYTCMEGSKTGKAAEADIIIGIGMYPKSSGLEGEEDLTRVLCLSKNKISGQHGTCIAILNKALSRYEC